MGKLGRGIVTALDRAGHVSQQPPLWAGLAAALAATGAKGRRAAARGTACYAVAAVAANVVVKPVVRRPRPPEAGKGRVGPVTTSFPSGHAATDLAFAFGAAQELPALMLVLPGLTFAAHWSLVRTRGHYLGDVLAGGALGIVVALALGRAWPSSRGSGPSGPGPG